jgi:hypothetical protein
MTLGLLALGLVRAASARGLDLRRPIPVSGQFGYVGETLPEALDQLLVEGPLGRAELVEAPESLFAHVNESGSQQVIQVMGRLGLWHPQDGDDVTDAELSILEQVEDAEAGPIREGPEHLVDRRAGLGFDGAHRSICTHLRDYSSRGSRLTRGISSLTPIVCPRTRP